LIEKRAAVVERATGVVFKLKALEGKVRAAWAV